jgi:alkanesulfonate monooxygenase SsuD/methylene tetrahydromethanopterin reductase-like flavin-dependent oxidoreductase (luciferase family)
VRIGIGLPNPVPGTPGRLFIDWARRAEERGFAGLATIDRLVYPSFDSLTTLAAAAGATTRIGLLSNILLGPLYPAPLLAKAAASIDQISGGRFTLGVGVGGRTDDFEVLGLDFHTRGKDLDASVDLMHRAWTGETFGDGSPITPTPVDGRAVPMLFGGTGDAAVRRTVRWGAGWALGGGQPEQAAQMAARVRAGWQEAGRDGEPRISALAYFSLGDEHTDASRGYLLDYYAGLGEWAPRIADGALRGASAIRSRAAEFEDAGVTELYLDPTVASLDQVDRLADVVL